MTEFETIKRALVRVGAKVDVAEFFIGKTISIPISTLLADNVFLELEFDAEGKLTDTFVLD